MTKPAKQRIFLKSIYTNVQSFLLEKQKTPLHYKRQSNYQSLFLHELSGSDDCIAGVSVTEIESSIISTSFSEKIVGIVFFARKALSPICVISDGRKWRLQMLYPIE